MIRFTARAARCVTSFCLSISIVTGVIAQDAPLPSTTTDYKIATAWIGDLDGMRQRHAIRVLTTYSKTNYFMDGPQPRGATYELLKEFQDDINEAVKSDPTLPIRIVIIPVPRDRLFAALAAGYGDIAAANLTVTETRSALADFSDPFVTDVKEVLVSGSAAPAVARIEELSGATISVRRSSSYWESLSALNVRLEGLGRAPVTLSPADENLEDEDLLELVSAGVLPFVIVDDHKAQFWASVLPGLTVREDLAVREGGQIAWAIRKGTPQLKQAVNSFVARARKGTALGNILAKRYFATNKWVRNPGTSDDFKRFQDSVDHLRLYAAEYDFDWLMIAAQAYQESRMDQTLRSPAGALGVMQLLPSTAADRNVGIPDINKLENNIHAGVKYLRFMTDRYFDDPAIDPINRTLFAFASYNAGPAKIARVRALAGKRGWNPNIWFHNVEYAAAEAIGRETVTYVSNIAKYHYAYQLILASLTGKDAAKQQMLQPASSNP